MRTFVLDETGKNRSTLEGGQDGMAEKEGAIEVACEIEGLGRLANRIVGDAAFGRGAGANAEGRGPGA